MTDIVTSLTHTSYLHNIITNNRPLKSICLWYNLQLFTMLSMDRWQRPFRWRTWIIDWHPNPSPGGDREKACQCSQYNHEEEEQDWQAPCQGHFSTSWWLDQGQICKQNFSSLCAESILQCHLCISVFLEIGWIVIRVHIVSDALTFSVLSHMSTCIVIDPLLTQPSKHFQLI